MFSLCTLTWITIKLYTTFVVKMYFLLLLSSLIYTVTATSYRSVIPPVDTIVTNNNYRLPNTTIPLKQSIVINITKESLNGGNTAFNGFTQIVLKVIKRTNTLYLNSYVDVDNLVIIDEEDRKIPILKYHLNATTNILMIRLKVVLFPGYYTLKTHFSSNLTTTDFVGITRISYNVNSSKEYLVVSHFKSPFPGFQEPQYKTKYILTIVYPKEYNGISNTPVDNTVERRGTKIRTFQETPRMSSYLLVFAIFKFDCSSAMNTVDNAPLRACSRNEFADDRSLAVEYGVKFLNAMSEWTNYNYSRGISKMDQFAFPSVFVLAMENWGFVVLSEIFLLSSPTDTSSEWKQFVLETISHEFSHQWFGNLVTIKWWDSLFLNEGVATYFQYALFTMIEELKHYEMEKQFIVAEQQGALAEDSSDSNALVSEVTTFTDIEGKFDTISYSKGASIIKMISYIMGDNNFQKGLRQYLKKHAFQSVTPEDLWEALSPLVNHNTLPRNVTLSKFVDSWINKPGYPVVNVVADGENIILSQKQFSTDDESNTQWFIPITYKTSANKTGLVWLEPNRSTILKKVISNNGWIIINHNSIGYYRVHYDNTLFDRLIKILTTNPSQIYDLDKAQIVDDSFHLALSGQITFLDLFRLLEFLKNESSYYPWRAAVRGIDELLPKVETDPEVLKNLNTLMSSLTENISGSMLTVNWKNVNHISSLKLPLIWTTECKVGKKKCVDASIRIFHQNDEIHPNIRSIVYCNDLKYGNDSYKDWIFLWKELQRTEQLHKKRDLFISLGCTVNKEHLNFYLQQSLDTKSGLTPLDFDTIWNSVTSGSPEGVEVAFEYFINHYIEISAFYAKYTSIFFVILEQLSTEEQLNKLEKFINQLGNSEVEQSLKEISELGLIRARERLQSNLKLQNDLKKYFNNVNNSIIKH